MTFNPIRYSCLFLLLAVMIGCGQEYSEKKEESKESKQESSSKQTDNKENSKEKSTDEESGKDEQDAGGPSKLSLNEIKLAAQIKECQVKMAAISQAIKMYKLNTGGWPSQMEDLIKLPQGMEKELWKGPFLEGSSIPNDPWGTPLRFAMVESPTKQGAEIRSAGPDKKFRTKDDIVD